MYFETECEMAVQGHPRSLISVPIESAFAISYWSPIVTLVLSCPFSEILQVFCSEQRLHPYSTRIFGVFLMAIPRFALRASRGKSNKISKKLQKNIFTQSLPLLRLLQNYPLEITPR